MKRWVLIAVVPIGIAIALALRKEPASTTTEAPEAVLPPTVSVPTVVHRQAPVVREGATLLAALESRDPIDQLRAIDAIEEAGCTPCLRELVRIDVTRDAQVGATTIAGIGALGKNASLPEKRLAVDRLVGLLSSERHRGGPEAAANVLGVLEALGGVEDPAAKRALERVLDDPSLDVATQILVIQGIGPHPSESTRRRLVAIRQERAREHGLDDFEEGLRRELDEAIAASLGG